MQASIRSLAPFAAAPQCAQRHRRSPVARADSGAAQLGSGDDCCLLPDGWEEPPSQSKRDTMNLLLAATLTLPVAGMVGPYAASFMPPRCAAAVATAAAAAYVAAQLISLSPLALGSSLLVLVSLSLVGCSFKYITSDGLQRWPPLSVIARI